MPRTKKKDVSPYDAFAEYQEQMNTIEGQSNSTDDERDTTSSLGVPDTDLDDLGMYFYSYRSFPP